LTPGKDAPQRPSPLQLTLRAGLLVFVAEMLSMYVVQLALPSAPLWVQVTLDATILFALMAPALLFLVFRPLAERARASEEALAAVFQASPIPMFALTPERNVSLWNRAAETVFGWRADEVVNRPYPLVPPEHDAEFKDLHARALAGEHLPGIEVQRRRKDGSLLCLKVLTAPLHDADGKVTAVLAVAEDVTERKRNEERLRLLGAAIESAANAVLITDRDGRIVWANEAFHRLTGWSLDECRGRTPRILRSGEHDRPFFAEMWRTILEGGVWRHEMKNRRKDGEVYVEEQTITPVKDERGEITHFVAIKTDIGERKRSEQVILKEKLFSEAMVNSLPWIFYLFDQTGRLLRWNRNFEVVSGYSPDEIARLRPLDFFAGEDHALVAERIRQVFETGTSDAEVVLVSKDGRRIPHYVAGVRIVVDDVPCCIGTGIDLTARKQLEAELRQSQKMEAVGQLAGGIAHDFNNILAVITGYSELTLGTLPAADPLRPGVEEIQKAADRAAALTRQLLTFSRKQVIQPTILELTDVLRNMAGMLSRVIREDIRLSTVFASEPLPIHADRGQVEQMILNLVVNARDAMPHGGRLVIQTDAVEWDDAACRDHAGATPGVYVRLTVSDTGIGMDDETRSHIFEPFFTTKETGRGTGLGLATVFGIVQQCGGRIEVESEVGRGATFRIYLPRAARAAEQAPASAVPHGAPRGSETILVVEDEPALRTLARRVLRSYGYAVLEAADGVEALAVVERHGGPIHLLVTDVVMPNMGGRELAERLTALRPAIRILYMSGYSDDAIIRSSLGAGTAFIQKPYAPAALARRIGELLATTR